MQPTKTAGGLRAVGVEEEFLLVDFANGRPMAAADFVLSAAQSQRADARAAGTLHPNAPALTREVKQEQLEAVSPPCRTLDEIAQAITLGRQTIDEAAASVDARAVALATSPHPVTTHVVPHPRYEAMQTQYGLTLKEQLTCGFHVHVSVESPEEGVAVLDRIRPLLPVLHALSANSPFSQGEDSTYASYRYQMWCRWPTAGPYDLFGSPEAYRRTVNSLITTGVILDPGMIYFDARLSQHHPTVEVRVADVCMHPEHAVAIAGLVRALVETAANEWRAGSQPSSIPTSLLRLAMWSASRYGLEHTLVNPHRGEPCSARAAVDALLAHVQPALAASGDAERVKRTIDQIFCQGTGAARQRAVYQRTRSLREVVIDAVEITHARVLSPGVKTAA
jgi:carboxylate-amine ligase